MGLGGTYPIHLLQKQLGAVPAEVLGQYGVSLPLRSGRHLSTEEGAVERLCDQGQTETRRPAVNRQGSFFVLPQISRMKQKLIF